MNQSSKQCHNVVPTADQMSFIEKSGSSTMCSTQLFDPEYFANHYLVNIQECTKKYTSQKHCQAYLNQIPYVNPIETQRKPNTGPSFCKKERQGRHNYHPCSKPIIFPTTFFMVPINPNCTILAFI